MPTEHYYVIPDIHGRYDLLKMALDEIYSQNPNGGKIIFLGDYIDRGPENVDVILTVMNPPENWEFVTLTGNHEDMFVEAVLRTGNYYDLNVVHEIESRPEISIREVTRWFESLPLFHFEDNNVFAHAWYDGFTNPDEQDNGYVLWMRMSDEETYNSRDGLYLTHGHTPRKHGPTKTINRCNLDCGAVFYDRLVVGLYEKGRQGPVTFLEFMKQE